MLEWREYPEGFSGIDNLLGARLGIYRFSSSLCPVQKISGLTIESACLI